MYPPATLVQLPPFRHGAYTIHSSVSMGRKQQTLYKTTCTLLLHWYSFLRSGMGYTLYTHQYLWEENNNIYIKLPVPSCYIGTPSSVQAKGVHCTLISIYEMIYKTTCTLLLCWYSFLHSGMGRTLYTHQYLRRRKQQTFI